MAGVEHTGAKKGEQHTISRKGRTEARGPACRKRNANDDSTRTRRTIRSSTCASNYFAPPGQTRHRSMASMF